ncbi:hypothetical protein MQ4_47 [Serratia phage MQ-4]|nr:hypothetical protein MQ4_47 [Serratia phage MQ-4]
MAKATPWQHDIAAAIAEARRRRVTGKQHYAVVQMGDRVGVYEAGKPAAARPLWTTRDDCRGAVESFRRRCKLSIDDIPLIAELRRDGLTEREVAAKFDVSVSAISDAMRGKSWGGIRRFTRCKHV